VNRLQLDGIVRAGGPGTQGPAIQMVHMHDCLNS